MLKHRWTDRICCIVLAAMLMLTGTLMGAASTSVGEEGRTMGYENRLFDQSRVHSIEIVMDDWEGFLETCTNEEYAACTVIIDGEAYKNVGIRAKGNTSLSSVAAYGNNRYSFKVEFDQYSPGSSYHGLDKLSLNNVIQDYTYMKDYLAYTLMNEMGVAAPLCSFANISVNGETWGLYLAVEAVEDSFLQRNYGADYGELYKPDSMSFGGGRGNGMDFDMEAFVENFSSEEMESIVSAFSEAMESGQMPEGMDLSNVPQMGEMPEGMDFSNMPQMGEMSEGMSIPGMAEASGEVQDGEAQADAESAASSNRFSRGGFGGMGGGFGGMGSSDVKLQYIDDDPSSYSNIFNNAKTDVTEADQQRLIASLQALGEGDSSTVDVEAVIRYLVVHNFMCNGDSYTGSMVHNYYLYEEDGVLEMIPWDYNLSMGAFSMGSDATSVVNSPIDSPVSDGDISDRPMVAWIFADETYTQLYHEIYAQFVEQIFTSGWFVQKLDETIELIAPYVEADPTAFYGYEQFQNGVETLREFCLLRAESISGQLDGTIPSETDSQRTAQDALIDASHLNLSDMGSMGNVGGGRGGDMGDMSGFGGRGNRETRQIDGSTGETADMASQPSEQTVLPGGVSMNGMPEMPSGGEMPAGMGGMPGSMMQMPGAAGGTTAEISETAGVPEMPGSMGAIPGEAPAGMNPEGDADASSAGVPEMPGGMGAMPGETPAGMNPEGDADASSAEASEAVENPRAANSDEEPTVDSVSGEAASATEAPSAEAQAAPSTGAAAPDSQRNAAQEWSAARQGAGTASANGEAWLLLGASVVVLIVGLIVAKRFKGHF